MSSLKVLRDEIIWGFNDISSSGGSSSGGGSGSGGSGSGGSGSGGSSSTTGAMLNKAKFKQYLKQTDWSDYTPQGYDDGESDDGGSFYPKNVVFTNTNPNVNNDNIVFKNGKQITINPVIVSDDPTTEFPGIVYAIVDIASQTLYIYPNKNNTEIYAPEDCGGLFNPTGNNSDEIDLYTGFGISSVDCSKLNTSRVTNMEAMFMGCTSLVKINMANIDTSKVIHMQYMFAGIGMGSKPGSYLKMDNWNTNNVLDFGFMFYSDWFLATNMDSLNMSSFDFNNKAVLTDMFADTSSTEVKEFSIYVKNETYKNRLEAEARDTTMPAKWVFKVGPSV